MQPPVKNQADIGEDNQTVDASDGPHNKDMARQEFKNEADINYMLSRFGITEPRGTPTYGEWDDSINLQSAIAAVAEAREGYQTLPEEMRNKFKSMEEMLTALQNGSLVLEQGDVPEPKPTTEELLQKRIATLEERLTRPPDVAPPCRLTPALRVRGAPVGPDANQTLRKINLTPECLSPKMRGILTRSNKMDLSDLDYEMRRRDEDLERHIRKLTARIDELTDALNELKWKVNDILNGDDVE